MYIENYKKKIRKKDFCLTGGASERCGLVRNLSMFFLRLPLKQTAKGNLKTKTKRDYLHLFKFRRMAGKKKLILGTTL